MDMQLSIAAHGHVGLSCCEVMAHWIGLDYSLVLSSPPLRNASWPASAMAGTAAELWTSMGLYDDAHCGVATINHGMEYE